MDSNLILEVAGGACFALFSRQVNGGFTTDAGAG